ncbi:astacin-like metalloendopeptidase isoform X2 [Megalobrama amblycephala]|uniref:astacin-like metalloendopeptidase isoform X2 n=1 Tax=Megalobrama amblycephala TaxID=75352 RepID=UPI0020141F4D|nr:astacin-like metalloendopeptidase isoform X2 [Megalobrama amblycephala]
MMWFVLLVMCFCEVQEVPADTLKVSDIQHDEGHINSLKSGQPNLRIPSETALDFEEDYAVQEGDLLLPSDRNAVNQLWPGVDGHLPVPYEIDSALESRTEDILKALNMISEKTCIEFLPHTKETDYLHFEKSNGCASYVGCMGGKEDNFMKKEGNTLGLKYDLESILHYGDKYFSRNGKPTILPKESGVKLGQRAYLSDLDVQKLRKLYHCDKKEGDQAAS